MKALSVFLLLGLLATSGRCSPASSSGGQSTGLGAGTVVEPDCESARVDCCVTSVLPDAGACATYLPNCVAAFQLLLDEGYCGTFSYRTFVANDASVDALEGEFDASTDADLGD